MYTKKDEVELLEDIKRLLILGLITNGVQSKDVAKALGVVPSVVTKLVAVRKIERYK